MEILIIAVSGGIDSMALLHMMVKKGGARLVVAHVNHGMRPDSHEDEQLVRSEAKRYGLKFFSTQLNLGELASEDLARRQRYAWLNELAQSLNATAIVTAHHQDDVIETVFINLIRGTGWRGLVSLRSQADLRRPLLQKTKVELVQYAVSNQLNWREDSTNDNPRYLRNYVRLAILPALSSRQRQTLVHLYNQQLQLRQLIDDEVERLLSIASSDQTLPRYFMIMLEPEVSYQIIRRWLNRNLTKTQRHRLRRFIATAKPGAVIELEDNCCLQVTARDLVVYPAAIR